MASLQWIRQLFHVGLPLPRAPHKQDSLISSLALMLLIIGLGIAMILGHACSSKHSINPVPQWSLSVTESAILLVAIFVIQFICACQNAVLPEAGPEDFDGHVTQRRRQFPAHGTDKVKQHIRGHLRLIGIVVFCVLGLILELIKIGANLEKFVSHIHHPFDAVTVTLFHVCRLVFVAQVTRLTFLLHNASVKAEYRGTFHYCLAVILAAIIVMLFDCIFDLNSGRRLREGYVDPCNHMPPETFKIAISPKCLCNSSTESLLCFNETSHAIFASNNMELLVLTMEILVQFFIRISKPVTPVIDYVQPPADSSVINPNEPSHVVNESSDDPVNPCNSVSSGYSSDREVHIDTSLVLTDERTVRRSGDHVSTVVRHQRSRASGLLAFVISPILSGILILSSAFSVSDIADYFCRIVWHCVASIYSFLCTAIILIAYKCSETTGKASLTRRRAGRVKMNNGFHGMELIVLICTLADYIWNFMSIFLFLKIVYDFDNIHSRDEYVSDLSETIVWMALLNRCSQLVSTYCKSVFLFHAIQVKWPITTSKNVETTRRSVSSNTFTPTRKLYSSEIANRRKYFLECTLFLSVACVTVWVIDSFINTAEAMNDTKSVQYHYYGEKTITILFPLFMPFIVFFNFNAFFILMGVYLQG